MRAYVLTDAALVKHAGRFVWLAVNRESTANARFFERFPVESLPTYLVVDGEHERAAMSWLGSATVPQMERLLDDAERALRPGPADPASAALARGDGLQADGHAADAARAYREALAAAPADWPRRTRAIESLDIALASSGDARACAALAVAEAPRLPRGPSFANVAATGLDCALGTGDEQAVATLAALVEEAVALPGLLGDDRAALYQLRVQLAEHRKDEAAARRAALDWFAFLDAEAARAPSPEARGALDGHRVAAALALHDPARALPALVASERDLPTDGNPPARLAKIYFALGRLDDALAASDRALARTPGPRRLRVLDERATILEKRGDHAGALRALDDALAFAATLPASQSSPRSVEPLRKHRARLAAAPRR